MKNEADGICTMVSQRPYMSSYGIRVRPKVSRPLYTVILIMMIELDSTVRAEMERVA